MESGAARKTRYFSDILIEQLRSVASLVSILSPAYVNSKWGRRELTEFCRAAEQSGNLQVSDKARVFKVLKTPVPLDQHPPELQPFLGTSSSKWILRPDGSASCPRCSATAHNATSG